MHYFLVVLAPSFHRPPIIMFLKTPNPDSSSGVAACEPSMEFTFLKGHKTKQNNKDKHAAKATRGLQSLKCLLSGPLQQTSSGVITL